MKKRLAKSMTMMLIVAFLVAFMPLKVVEAKGKTKLSASKCTIQVGKTYDLKLKNAKNVKWKTSNRAITTITRKNTNTVRIKGKKAGKATITGKYKKKKYKCVVTVKAKQQEQEHPALNATDVTLYYLDEDNKDYIEYDANHIREFCFTVTGTKKEVDKWELIGEDKDFFNLTTYGKLTMRWEPSYENNPVKVKVRATLENGKVLEANVKAYSEGVLYLEKLLTQFENTYITNTMTEYEKVDKIAWYISTYTDYKAGCSGWTNLFIRGYGDCAASRVAVAELCKRQGIKAQGCSFEYHGETIVKADGKYYMVITGYNEPKPRSYAIYEIVTDDMESFCKERDVYWGWLK